MGGIDFSKPVLLGYSGLSDALLLKYIEDSRHIWEDNLKEVHYTDKCAYSYKVDAVSGDIIGKKTDWFSRQESETVPETSQNSDSKQRTDD